MKTSYKITSALFALCMFGLLSGTAFAQYDNSSLQTVDAHARIVTGITLTNVQELDFGIIIANALGGTVIVTPTNAVSTTNGLMMQQNSVNKQATFTVTGEPGYEYDIILPSSGITITGPGAPMGFDTWTSLPDASAGAVTLDATLGTSAFAVRATLNVGTAQTPWK